MTNSNWIESSPKNPCPVCGRTHDRDCGVHVDGKTVICRTRANSASKVAQPPDEINGYKFTGKFEKKGIQERAVYMKVGFEQWKKPIAARNDQAFYYPALNGSPVARTRRIDDGKGKKYVWQEYWIPGDRLKAYKTQDDWVKLSQRLVDEGKATQEDYDFYREIVAELEKSIHLYQIGHELNQGAIKAGEKIFVVEGEALADLLLALKIPAVTNLGGSKKWEQYGGKHGNYAKDLAGAELVLCPDCDAPGMEHSRQVAKVMKGAKISWLYANPASLRWADPSEGEGYDLRDWIMELRSTKMSDEHIKESIEKSIEKSERKFKAAAIAQQESMSLRDLIASGYVDSTAEHWVYDNWFKGGLGDWAVLDSTFYRYTCGCWHQVGEQEVKGDVFRQTLGLYTVTKDGERKYKYATTATGNSCLEFARQLLPPRTLPAESRYLRVFNNCTVDMRTGEQLPHNRNHYATVRIDSNYEPGVECPAVFREFVEKHYGADLMPLIRAVTNMLLNPSAPWHFFAHLQGASGSGKGTLSRFWQELFGEGNVSSCGRLSELAKPEGRHQFMTNVSLLVFADLNGMLKDVTDFYELVDNGAMSGRALYDKVGYTKKWNTRFVLCSVLPLRVENSGEGWDRRQILIPTLGVKVNDHYIDDRLSNPEVTSGVISWALAMDPVERDDLLWNSTTLSEKIEESKREARLAGDPVASFVDHCLRPSPGAPKLKSVHLHTLFTAYAKVMGYSEIGEKFFTQRLKSVIELHYSARRKAKKTLGEVPDQDHGMLSPGWLNLEVLPGIFNTVLEQTICVKNKVEEGGLQAFELYKEMIEGGTQGTEVGVGAEPTNVPSETQPQQSLESFGTQVTQGTEGNPIFYKKKPSPLEEVDNKEKSLEIPDPFVTDVPEPQDVDVEPASGGTEVEGGDQPTSVPCVPATKKVRTATKTANLRIKKPKANQGEPTHGCIVLDLVTNLEALFDEWQGDIAVLIISEPGKRDRYVSRTRNEFEV